MKSFAVVALAALSFASQTAAEILFFTSPINTTVWTAGQKGTVSWSNDCAALPGNHTFPIFLNQQSAAGQQVPVPGATDAIGYLDCSDAGSTSVTVPMVPAGSLYSVYVANGADQSYSALFKIESTIVATSASGAASSAVPTATSASASASVSASIRPVTTTTPKPSTTPNHAGSLKAGSTAALVIVAAVASLML
ncbi:MAG: hypothetical protein J3Q66DRAFT_338937 [Benniella sp.]|nr:MAG: hypothetical protein J3Q66DRAFT_338937 [Benniella sp.]